MTGADLLGLTLEDATRLAELSGLEIGRAHV